MASRKRPASLNRRGGPAAALSPCETDDSDQETLIQEALSEVEDATPTAQEDIAESSFQNRWKQHPAQTQNQREANEPDTKPRTPEEESRETKRRRPIQLGQDGASRSAVPIAALMAGGRVRGAVPRGLPHGSTFAEPEPEIHGHPYV